MRRFLGLALGALCLMPAAAQALPPANLDPGAWIPDARVDQVVHSGNTTYLAGSFNWVGPWTGEGASLAVPSGVPDHSFPLVSGGAILASVPDTLGGVFIGGTFTHIGGQAVANLAHISSSGTVLPFTPNPDGAVTSLALGGPQELLYVGGRFASIGGVARRGLAALNPLTAAVSDGFAPCPDFGSSDASGDQPYPFALAVSASTVYVGGDFAFAAGGPANPSTHVPSCSSEITADNLFAVNASTGNVVPGFTPDPAGEVDALALSPGGDTLYLGGQFDYIGTDGLLSKLAAVNANTGALDTAWNPQVAGDVAALQTTGSSVYVGGDFATIGANAAPRAGVAQVNGVGATANATSFNAGLKPGPGGEEAIVRTLTLDDPLAPTRLAIGGLFASSAGPDNLALGNPQTGALDAGFAPEPGGEVSASAFESPAALYAGGYFESVGAVRRSGLVALDGNGHPTSVDFAGASVEAQVAVSPDGSTIYASGAYGPGAWSARTGAALPWKPALGAPGAIDAITVAPDDSAVYLGGQFSNVGGLPRDNLVAVSPTTGNPTSWHPDPDGEIDAIAVSPDATTVYVGGLFQHVGTSVSPRTDLAALSSASGDTTPWSPNPNGQVDALTITGDGTHIFAGGPFTSIGAQPQARANVAELTTSTANPTPFAAAASPNGPPNSIVPADGGSVVYIGGAFDADNGFPAPGFAALDGGSGSHLLAWQPFYHAAGPLHSTVAADGDTVWAGDWGTELGTDRRPYYAQFSSAPVSIASPTLSAAPRSTVAVSCVTGGWQNAPATISVSWQLDGKPIAGASGRSFTPSAGQAGHTLSCAETAANPGGAASAAAVAVTVAASSPAQLSLSVSVSPRRFHSAKGTRIHVTLSAAATLQLTLTRNIAGRRIKHRCSSAPRRGSKTKRCVLMKPAGSVSWHVKAGASQLKLIGPHGRKLRPGSYTATFVAVAGSIKSRRVSAALTVLR